MRLGVVANMGKAGTPELLRRLREEAASLGMPLVTAEDAGAARELECPLVEGARLAGAADAVVSVGGDGTVLRAVRYLAGAVRPIVAVNLGHLGFLTRVSPEGMGAALKALVRGEGVRFIRAPLLWAVAGPAGGERYCALNDVVVGWNSLGRAARLCVEIGDDRPVDFLCDGMIVATPLGSTGHALSAGGPLLHRETPAVVLQPICPHTLSGRTMILPSGIPVRIRVTGGDGELALSVDGQQRGRLGAGGELRVECRPEGAVFAQFGEESWVGLLEHKLHWRGRNTDR